ncbi:MAG TPA: hypothetical protein VGH44_02250 [Candidatus Saccharimonadia bacterium]|jgi:hypothetical protein
MGNIKMLGALFLAVAMVVGPVTPIWTGVAEAAKATATPLTRPTAPLRLTTSPLPIVLNTKPGQSASTDIKIKQSGGDTEQLQVSLMKFSATGETGQPKLSDRGPGDDYFDWVTFDRPTFTAPNDVWQTVKMTVNVPKSAAFSYYYAVVFSRVGDTIKVGNGQSGIAGGTAVLVMMSVDSPGASRSLQLATFSVAHRVMEFLPTDFTVRLKNNGNVFVRPGGNIFISQGNKQVGLVTVNSELGMVLSGSTRAFSAEWNYGFPYFNDVKIDGKNKIDKKGNPVRVLNWGLPEPDKTSAISSGEDDFIAKQSRNPLTNFRFGEYTAHLLITYPDNFGHDVPMESTLTFWVIPWRMLLVVLAILLVVGFGLYSSARRAMGWTKVVRKFGKRR